MAACAWSIVCRSHMRPGPMKHGEMALTRMPSGARSLDAARVRLMTAPLEAL